MPGDEFDTFLAHHTGIERGLNIALSIVREVRSQKAAEKKIRERIADLEAEKKQPLFKKTGAVKRKND